MDYSRDFPNGNVVHVIPGDNWLPNSLDPNSVWATEDEYRAWNNSDPQSDNTFQSSQTRSDSEPPNKKSKNNSQELISSKKSIGKMFFKTKLCCKFRAGTCPYITNCNFAHSIKELRHPPPNWQEIVASHEEDKGVVMEMREEYQIPSVGGFSGESQRSYKGRHCKKFYTEEGCPYGDNCTFLHDEQSKNRESVTISLGPGGYGGAGGAAGVSGGGNGANVKPSNWKTRICNKWELTGYCPFGNKCHFAHGAAELHQYCGGLVESEANEPSSAPADLKLGVALKSPADTVVASVPHSDAYHLGVPSQRPSILIQRSGLRAHQKWKGPDKISRIYGDWIDDTE